MVKVHIIKQGENAEVIVDTHGKKRFLPFESKNAVPKKLLHDFQLDWVSFYWQAQELRRNAPLSKNVDREIVASLRKKASYLTSCLIKKNEYFWERLQEPVLFSVDAEFANLPFEVLRIGDQYLYELVPVIRQIRGKRSFEREAKKKNRQLLCVLNPDDSEELETFIQKEKNILERFLSRQKISSQILKGKMIRPQLLLEELHAHEYVHFAGHTDKKGIPLSGEEYLPAEHIADLNLSNIKLIFMNSCYSSSQGKRYDSLSQAFVKAGVENYIGFNLPIGNTLAHFIADRFWALFQKSDDIPAILFQIRNEIKSKFGEAELGGIILNGFGHPRAVSSWRDLISEWSDIRKQNRQEKKGRKRKGFAGTLFLAALLLATFYLMKETHDLQTEYLTPSVFYSKIIQPKKYKRSKDCQEAMGKFKKLYKTGNVDKRSWVDFEDLIPDIIIYQCVLPEIK